MTKLEIKTKEIIKKKYELELKVPQSSNYGTGKRKNAIAKVWLFEGTGQISINNKLPLSYLGSEVLVSTILRPLELLGLSAKYDVKISTLGGGLVGQADACAHGISRALLELNESFRQKLKEAGLLTRDSRIKERKKYGRKKARKGYQFRKR
jgi:small subunit ribosomal protein S9